MNVDSVVEFARYEQLIAMNRKEAVMQKNQIRALQGRLAQNTRTCAGLKRQMRYLMHVLNSQRAICVERNVSNFCSIDDNGMNAFFSLNFSLSAFSSYKPFMTHQPTSSLRMLCATLRR